LYFNDKHYIKTNLVLCADGKNSQLRKLLLIKTILKKTGHIAISGFLEQSKNHQLTATQAFTELGPIGLLPFENKNKINFVLSVEETKYKKILSKNNPEQYICDKLEKFFSNLNLNFKPIKKINNLNNNLSSWPLDLNFIINPTANRAVLIGDAAHSIHPLAGQGLNLAMRDCVSVMNSIEESSKFGNDLGDISILNSYKKDRLSKTIAMTAITDFLFYGFASDSNIAQTILSKGMETLNKSRLKNIFSKLAAK
jgi:2-octaprenyl-6-methoxyphenol hydroxylase